MSSTSWSEWRKNTKVLLTMGVVLVLLMSAVLYWWLQPTYVPAMVGRQHEQVASAVQQLDNAKIKYRVAQDGLTILVPQSDEGRAKALLGTAHMTGGGAGFELFNNTDFSTTEFSQKVNYQRALQGELARTIMGVQGVASVRVHLVLPESGFVRRKQTPASAAVHVTMQDGQALTNAQVHGIQQLVASSVPEIKSDAVTVVDQDGIVLSHAAKSPQVQHPAQGHVTLKKEVDAYLESKIRRLFLAMDPEGDISVSVDAALNLSDSKVTTEEVLLPEGFGRNTGVVVKERTVKRQEGVQSAQGGASSVGADSQTREIEYRVGQRTEQVATAAGGIERISVAVIIRSGHIRHSVAELRAMVAGAIGAREANDDMVTVMLLPQLQAPAASVAPATNLAPATAASNPSADVSDATFTDAPVIQGLLWLMGLALLSLLAWLGLRPKTDAAATAATQPAAMTDAEAEALAKRVSAWLQQKSPEVSADAA